MQCLPNNVKVTKLKEGDWQSMVHAWEVLEIAYFESEKLYGRGSSTQIIVHN